MNIFNSSGKKGVSIRGPMASVEVTIDALGDLVGSSWILSGMTIGAKEIADVRQCFNDTSFIYALGNDQRYCSMTLTFSIFAGQEDCDGRDGMGAIDRGISAYRSNRISSPESGQAPKRIGIGSLVRKGWLVGLNIGEMDARTGICRGLVHFIMELE